MNEHERPNDPSDAELDLLLRDAPPAERLPKDSREVIWKNISARLDDRKRDAQRRRFRARRLAWWAAGLVGAAAVLVLMFAVSKPERSDVPFGSAHIVRGQCVRTSAAGTESALTPEAALMSGDQVSVGPGGGMQLLLEDGSSLWLCDNSEAVCVGPRAEGKPTLRLLRGELRAKITPSETQPFSVETPAATLRVLGTEFNCRVLPPPNGASGIVQLLRGAFTKAIPTAVVVSVLSGSVAVEAADQKQVLTAGQRASIIPGDGTLKPETLSQLAYIRSWLGEPGERFTPEALVFVTSREYLLHALFAVNVETGAARYIGHFVGVVPDIEQRYNQELVLVNAGSVIFSPSSPDSVSNSGQSFVDYHQLILVNQSTGEKIPMNTFREYDTFISELSPDRRKVAFEGSRRLDEGGKREYGLFLRDLETNATQKLPIDGNPRWSPDSRWIAITHHQHGDQIILVDTITGKLKKTLLTGADVHFTPDGRLVISSGDRTHAHLAFSILHELRASSAESKRPRPWPPIPTNLYLARSWGWPKQITHLSDSRASFASFSPDGKRLVYWEWKEGKGEWNRPVSEPILLHVLDMDSGRDRVVLEESSYNWAWRSDITWLDDSRFLLSGMRRNAESGSFTGSMEVQKIVTLTQDGATVEEFTPQTPEIPDDLKAAAARMADRLLEVFDTYRQAVDLQDLDRIDQAVAKFRETRDLVAALIAELDQPQVWAPLALGAADLKPYLESFEKELAVSPEERTARAVKVIHDNLKSTIPMLLETHIREKGSLPTTLEGFADLLRAGQSVRFFGSPQDREYTLRLLGVHHDKLVDVPALYELVPSDDPERPWKLRTGVLSNGKRFEASYHYDYFGPGVPMAYADVVEVE